MQKIQSAKHFDIAQNIELDSFVVKQMLIIDLLMKIGNYVVSVQVSTVCNYLSELETERWILSYTPDVGCYFEQNYFSVSCCSTISITAFGPELYRHRYNMGQFNFKQSGLYGRPIYQNSRGRYLFYSDYGQWLVSLTNVNISDIKSLILQFYI